MVDIVGGGEDLGFVDVVDTEGLKYLGLDEVSDAGLGHHRDGYGADDRVDEVRVAHPSDPTLCADVGGDAFECHHGGGSRRLGDACLLFVDDVHDDAALEHLSQSGVEQGLCFGHCGVDPFTVAEPIRVDAGSRPERYLSAARESEGS